MRQHEILYHFFKLKKRKEICFCVSVQTDERLNVLGLYYIHVPNAKKLPVNWVNRTRHYMPKSELSNMQIGGLGMPYTPAAEPPVKSLETVVPDSMGYEIHAALHRLKKEVGNINDYVRRHMGYASDTELASALSAEQVDAVALAVYNIEVRNEGMITGDQTGIGKGRIAASLIRVYARMGLKPVFITEKPNLFSDIYRDLVAIGSGDLVPFIVNGRESKTQVKDEDGHVIYEAFEKSVQESYFNEGNIPGECDFVMATYSQFASNNPTVKQSFLQSIAQDNVLILDESHNAGGNIETSATARLFYDIVKKTRGVLFLSATFAKRPDNMPLYAVKTCMSETAMTNDALVEAISRGGVALQEVLSASLVAEGQMIRRERSFEGVEVNYISLNTDGKRDFGVEDLEKQHLSIADKITDILRGIIRFEDVYIKKAVDSMDREVKAEMKQVEKRKGTSEMGVSSTPYFSKLFMVINQMLFSIKAEAVARRAIQRLQEGKKPVIAFASTMGAFLEGMENDHGEPVADGDMINADFSEVLFRGLESLFAITEIHANGDREKKRLSLAALPTEAHRDHEILLSRIRKISTGISISPIDNIKFYIEQAGYSVAEVTGRKLELNFQKQGSMAAMVKNRRKENVSDAFRKFNNNQVDVLLINQSGSTGASAHAIVTPRVPLDKVKQRVMIVLQPELDINREVQKRGRINRTGQVYKPIYDYINSAIPAEQRLTMMLQRKLKSLDANTTSNQKQSKSLLESPDFLNKYGDRVVVDYLKENPDINELLGDPAGLEEDENPPVEGMALKVSGRVAILSCEGQQAFYDTVFEGYNTRVSYAKQTGTYDLEVEDMDLQAETLTKEVFIYGKGGRSDFGGDSFLEKVEANVLRKPFSKKEVEQLVKESLGGKTPEDLQTELTATMKTFMLARAERETNDIESQIQERIRDIPNEEKYGKATNKEQYIRDRTTELEESRAERIKNMRNKLNNEFSYINSFFSAVRVGQSINYQTATPDGEVDVPAVFLGFKINHNKPNPYAPSAIAARLATTDSNRYIELVLSGDQGNKLQAVFFASGRRGGGMNVLESWEEYTKNSNVNRRPRYIYTGNLLQAFDRAYSGKLINFTCKNGETRKGILMPEHWTPTEKGENTTRSVPLKFCRRAIMGLSRGAVLNTDIGVSFMMQYNGSFRIITQSLSMQKYEWLVKNKQLLPLINEQGGFQKTGASWVGSVDAGNLEKAIDIIYSESGCNAKLTVSQVEMIQQDIVRREVKPKERIKLPEITAKPIDNLAKRSHEATASNSQSKIENGKIRRLRIAKAKAIAKLKILNLLKL